MAVVQRPHTRICIAHLLAAALALGACGPEESEGRFPDQILETDAGETAIDEIQLGTGSGTGTMDGTWLLIHEQSNCVEALSFLDEALSVTFEIVEIEQNGNQLRETHNVCSLRLTKLLQLETTFPQAAAQSVNPIIVDDSYVSLVGRGGGYASGVEYQPFGLDWPDPLTGDHPEDASDPRVVDGDGDGNPGITLEINGGADNNGCDMYITQSSVLRYHGTFTTPTLIEGNSVTFFEQEVMGASSTLCGVPRNLYPNDAFSRFLMARIDGQGGAPDFDFDEDGAITCEDIARVETEIWDYREKDCYRCGATEDNCPLN